MLPSVTPNCQVTMIVRIEIFNCSKDSLCYFLLDKSYLSITLIKCLKNLLFCCSAVFQKVCQSVGHSLIIQGDIEFTISNIE